MAWSVGSQRRWDGRAEELMRALKKQCPLMNLEHTIQHDLSDNIAPSLTTFRNTHDRTGFLSQIRTKLRDWAGKGALPFSGSNVLK